MTNGPSSLLPGACGLSPLTYPPHPPPHTHTLSLSPFLVTC